MPFNSFEYENFIKKNNWTKIVNAKTIAISMKLFKGWSKKQFKRPLEMTKILWIIIGLIIKWISFQISLIY